MNKNQIQNWWKKNPMTYGENHGEGLFNSRKEKIGTKKFFEKSDSVLLSWNHPLHIEKPFDKIFPFGEYANQGKILEIGCGLGKMASLWAQNGSDVTAIDLNETSVRLTKKRFKLKKLKGSIKKMSSHNLKFKNEHFDYIFSWGVLHHSPRLDLSIEEIFRVLKKNGKFGLMLYNRNSILFWYFVIFLEGFLHHEKKYLSSLELASRYTDGGRENGNPYTWPVTKKEIERLLLPYAKQVSVRTLGTDLDSVLKFVCPYFGSIMPILFKKTLARRFGWSLWISGIKA